MTVEQPVDDLPNLSSDLIRRVANELSAASSARDRTEKVIAVLGEALNVRVALVYGRNVVAGGAPVVYSRGLSDELASRMTDREVDADLVARLESFVHVVAVARKPREASLAGSVYDQLDGLKWSASFPVCSGSEVVGVLIFAWPERRPLSQEQLDLCETAGALIGIALRQDVLIERNSEVAVLQERARMARDIHDSVTQAVTATVLNIEAADRALTEDPEAARRALGAAKQLARDSLVDLRRSIWNLRAGLTQWRSLSDSIKDVTQPLSEVGIDCRIEVHGQAEHVPVEIAAAALSIVRESASNILRHSRATAAEVQLIAASDSVTVTITDNGVGIGKTISEVSFGLIGMEERVQSVGGALNVRSWPGHGTRVEATLPYGKPGVESPAPRVHL
jgi:signal transduction histidine kinase